LCYPGTSSTRAHRGPDLEKKRKNEEDVTLFLDVAPKRFYYFDILLLKIWIFFLLDKRPNVYKNCKKIKHIFLDLQCAVNFFHRKLENTAFLMAAWSRLVSTKTNRSLLQYHHLCVQLPTQFLRRMCKVPGKVRLYVCAQTIVGRCWCLLFYILKIIID